MRYSIIPFLAVILLNVGCDGNEKKEKLRIIQCTSIDGFVSGSIEGKNAHDEYLLTKKEIYLDSLAQAGNIPEAEAKIQKLEFKFKIDSFNIQQEKEAKLINISEF